VGLLSQLSDRLQPGSTLSILSEITKQTISLGQPGEVTRKDPREHYRKWSKKDERCYL